MLKTEKETKVQEFELLLENARGIYLADYKGMTVEVISELRKRCREADIHFEVTKNTLLRRAAEAKGRGEMLPYIAGPTAVAISQIDEVAPAKVLIDFAKEFKDQPEVRSGFVAGRIFEAEEVKALAKLPSKEVLMSQLLSVLQAPVRNFASVLQAPLRNLANVLDQVSQQKKSAA